MRAVFVYRTGTARGYPLDATGETQPCAVFPVADVWGPITISRYGYLHVAAFQNGTASYPVYAPNANGNPAPVRLIAAERDRFSLATDSSVTDYVVDGTSTINCWEAELPTGDGSPRRNCTADPSRAIGAVAVEPDNRLVVVSSANGTTPRIELYVNATSGAPQLVQTIAGAATMLPDHATQYGATTDPANGDIYVYSAGPAVAARVLVFASSANGNVAPKRVLTVPDATDWGDGFHGAGSNVLAVDDRGQLYVGLRANVIVQVYAAGASGNAAPIRTITDASAPTTDQGFFNLLPTSVAVRTAIQ